MTTKLCIHYSDITVVPPIEGGCMYEMPAGDCYEDELDDRTKGYVLRARTNTTIVVRITNMNVKTRCAEAMESYLAAAVSSVIARVRW